MKEILEAIESRVKSPLLGYFTLAFIAVNWKAIFYLLVEDKGAIDRISYFESNTNLFSLLVIPAIAAGIFSIIYPWINYFFLYLCIKPTELRNGLQARSEHNLLIVKQNLEEIRSAMLSSAERELIERAKRDEELNEIEDQEIKEKLKSEIEQLRIERGPLEDSNLDPQDFEQPDKLLDFASKYRTRAEKATDYTDRNRLIERARELEEKAHSIILAPKNA